jgi:hypothetical protein
MATLLLCIAGIFVLLSFYGLMASLMRFAAVICIAGGIWFWSQESREVMAQQLEHSYNKLVERGQNLSPDDKALLKKALEGADTLLEDQRKRLKGLVEKLGENSAIQENEEASAVLEKLRERS